MASSFLFGEGREPVAVVLDPRDTVAVSLRALRAGDRLRPAGGGEEIVVRQEVPFAFKVSLTPHGTGDLVYKYGLPIGRCTAAVAAGEIVHTHNLVTLQDGPSGAASLAPGALGSMREAGGEPGRRQPGFDLELPEIVGYARPDGSVGIRNHIAVIFTSESVRGIAASIAWGDENAHVFGYRGAHASERVRKTLLGLGAHPNVGAALVVSMGDEELDAASLAHRLAASDRPVEHVAVKEARGTSGAVRSGRLALDGLRAKIQNAPRARMSMEDLVVGVECGGSDATSGIAANPACGLAIDRFLDMGGTALFLEVNELLGCEPYLADRAVSDEVRRRIFAAIDTARAQAIKAGHFAFAAGNAEGGLTTIEEKSLGALLKGGSRPVNGVLAPFERPPGKGLYFIDFTQPVGSEVFGYYEDNDPEGVGAMVASGAHMVLFTTGRGSVTGSVVGPVIKICGNPGTFAAMPGDFDVNAGAVITGERSLEEVAGEILTRIAQTAAGALTAPERLGHREYWVPYKR